MIEEEFMQMAIDEFKGLDLDDSEGGEEDKILALVTRLQTAAYARGKMDSTTESIESLPQPSVFPTVIFPDQEPKTVSIEAYRPHVGTYSPLEFLVCFDCGALIEGEMRSIHFRFHDELNNAAGSYITGYSEDE